MLKLIAVAFLLLTTPLQAASFKETWQALFSEQYSEAIAGARDLQLNEDPRGNFLFGYMYLFGKGLEQDPVKAESYFKRASEAGFNGATFRLGKMYREGHPGVPKQTALAYQLISQAAEKGGPNAQFNLAQMVENGEGTEINWERAFKLYQGAASKKHAFAHWNLGYYYLTGRVVAKDVNKASEHFEIAFKEGSAKWLAIEINRRLIEDITPEIRGVLEEQLITLPRSPRD
jgi:TPR repeat protein